jgi:nucleoside 2-deoxyribosyltransferase
MTRAYATKPPRGGEAGETTTMRAEAGTEAPRKIVYLAGPEVFLPQATALGEQKKQICLAHNLDARFPLDQQPRATAVSPRDKAMAIFATCIEMMAECDLVIANMTPFRGVSMDVGTAVEIGYMHALGKPVFGYTNVTDDYADRVRTAALAAGEDVEAFGLADNLMCECPVIHSGTDVVRWPVDDGEVLTALGGFEKCVWRAAQASANATTRAIHSDDDSTGTRP